MNFVAIYIPEFPVAAWLRSEPRAGAGAIAILEGEAPLEHVVSLNRAAAALGLKRGMTRVQAETAGPVQLRARSLAEEQAAFALAWSATRRFSPSRQALTGPANAYAGDRQLAVSLLLDRSGTETLLGSAREYAEALARELLAASLPAHIAVSPNAEASRMLARSCPGITVAEPKQLTGKLAGLAVHALPCSAQTLATLTRWGIRTLGELAALPEDALVNRLGQQGRRLRRLVIGDQESLLIPEQEPFALFEQIALDTPISLLDSLLFVISPMLERLMRQAVERACALRSLTLTLNLAKQGSHTVAIRPSTPSRDRAQLIKLLNLRLQADPPRAAIVALSLAAEPALPQVAQRGLFQAQFPEGGKLDVLIARLGSIAGEAHVGSPRLVNSHYDDLFQLSAFTPSASSSTSLSKTSLSKHSEKSTSPVALRRCRPPEPVSVTVHLGAPCAVIFRGLQLKIATAAGPWQSSGSWWDEHSRQAEEWDAVVREPLQTLRLRHERRQKTWYVAGVYD